MAILKRLSFRREVTRRLLYAMNICGVFPIEAQADTVIRYFWLGFLTYGTLFMSGTSAVEPFLRDYDFVAQVTAVLNVLTSAVSYCNTLILLRCRKTMVRMLPLVDSGFFVYSDERVFQITEYATRDLLMQEVYICGSVWITYIGMTLTPLVVALLRTDHVNTGIDLLYVGWVPFDFTAKRQYVFSFIMQWITTVPLYTSFVGRILFISHVKREFEYQCDKLKYAIRTICDRVSKKVVLQQRPRHIADVRVQIRVKRGEQESSSRTALPSQSLSDTPISCSFVKCDEVEVLRKLAECEFHYQQLQKYVYQSIKPYPTLLPVYNSGHVSMALFTVAYTGRWSRGFTLRPLLRVTCLQKILTLALLRGMEYFSAWFNPMFSCELTYGFLSFALIGYLLIQGTGNHATDMKYVCLLGLFGGQLWYQCVAGDIFKTLEESIVEELYAIPWHDQTPKVKRTVRMFLHHLQKEQRFRGFKIFPASIQIFASIMRTSYSYLNILNKIMHNK